MTAAEKKPFIEQWTYPVGNAEAERKVRQAVQDRIDSGINAVAVARNFEDGKEYYGVERIEIGP